MSKEFERQIIKNIEAYNMFGPGDYVVAGVSGGKDSVCMLYILDKLSEEWGFSLSVIHVNHMLRGEDAERDMDFVKRLCGEMKIPCTAVYRDVNKLAHEKGLSTEEAGRAARQEIFAQAVRDILKKDARAKCCVALGHHKDDNVETILLNLARGSNLNGITGMMPVRCQKDITYVRPLLCVTREEVEAYVSELGLPYVNDASNTSEEYARNKIRLRVVPELLRVNSRVIDHINDTAGGLIQIQEYMERQIDEAIRGIVDQRDDSISIDVAKIRVMDPAIQTGIVYRCLGTAAGTRKNISHIHVNDVISLIGKQTGRQIELPYGLVAQRRYGHIRISKGDSVSGANVRADYNMQPLHLKLDSHIDISMREVQTGGVEFVTADGGHMTFDILDVNDGNRSFLMKNNPYTKAFDYDTIKGNLILGRPEPDDIISFMGGTKSLKKYFIDEKIPLEIRNQLLVLKDLNEVLWVLGYRIGEQYKITERTRKALIVSVNGGNNE